MTPEGQRQLNRTHEEISDHLAAIAKLWRPGAKLTLLVRHPDTPDGSQDYLATDDNLNEAIRALHVLDARGATKP